MHFSQSYFIDASNNRRLRKGAFLCRLYIDVFKSALLGLDSAIVASYQINCKKSRDINALNLLYIFTDTSLLSSTRSHIHFSLSISQTYHHLSLCRVCTLLRVYSSYIKLSVIFESRYAMRRLILHNKQYAVIMQRLGYHVRGR